MTVTEDPTVPVSTDSAPQSDEGPAVQVELVKSGWVRLHWNDRTVRLRRPFFGELKRIRLALEDMADAIAERSDDVRESAAELVDANNAVDADESLDDAAKRRRRRELTNKSKVVARELTTFCDEQRIGWWREVVGIVGVDGALPEDDELPSWIADPYLPNEVLAHWRSVPLGRG